MKRLPLRLRVAGAFALAMAVVLVGTGAFLYLRLGHDLRLSLDRDLRLRADDVAALAAQPGRSLAALGKPGLVERGETFAQLLDESGRVLDATPTVARAALLDAGERAQALVGPRFSDRSSVPGLDEPARVLALPVERAGEPAILVVGATAEDRAEALADLRNALVIAFPLALALATGAGYLLAGAGLRAVEAMRARAAEISELRPGGRLPVPPSRDELELLGHTLNEMLGRLERALARERGFVADAGHELRTPVTLLRAELDFALHQAADEEELRAAVRRASDETDRLAQLAGDLLLLASTEQGTLPLRLEPVELGALLESVRNRFHWRAAAAGREIRLGVESRAPITADRLRLEQALGNLVDNALRHGAGEITVAAVAEGTAVELRVEDEGDGFPLDYLPQAFERFTRPDHGRSGGGTGLGLAIVDTIARAHGGSCRAENTADGGARVTLVLPSG